MLIQQYFPKAHLFSLKGILLFKFCKLKERHIYTTPRCLRDTQNGILPSLNGMVGCWKGESGVDVGAWLGLLSSSKPISCSKVLLNSLDTCCRNQLPPHVSRLNRQQFNAYHWPFSLSHSETGLHCIFGWHEAIISLVLKLTQNWYKTGITSSP